MVALVVVPQDEVFQPACVHLVRKHPNRNLHRFQQLEAHNLVSTEILVATLGFQAAVAELVLTDRIHQQAAV
jgi:hypothetical protein